MYLETLGSIKNIFRIVFDSSFKTRKTSRSHSSQKSDLEKEIFICRIQKTSEKTVGNTNRMQQDQQRFSDLRRELCDQSNFQSHRSINPEVNKTSPSSITCAFTKAWSSFNWANNKQEDHHRVRTPSRAQHLKTKKIKILLFYLDVTWFWNKQNIPLWGISLTQKKKKKKSFIKNQSWMPKFVQISWS